MRDNNRESFMVAARYDINSNQGDDSQYTRLTEALIRAYNPRFRQSEITGGPEPYSSGQIKARNGVKMVITIKSINDAMH